VTGALYTVWMALEAMELLVAFPNISKDVVHQMAHALDVLKRFEQEGTTFISGKHDSCYEQPTGDEQPLTSEALMTRQNLIHGLSFHKAYLEGNSTAEEDRDACLECSGGDQTDALQTCQVAALI